MNNQTKALYALLDSKVNARERTVGVPANIGSPLYRSWLKRRAAGIQRQLVAA